jgi:hypothetical protein
VPPEQLYRPDGSITAWRKWCHEHARQAPVPAAEPPPVAEPALVATGPTAAASKN